MNNIRYEYLLDIDKIKNVYHKIRVNTKNKNKLFSFEMFYLCNIYSILNVLKKHKYKHDRYHIFLINEPKYRLIMSEGISDKIVNHLISDYVLKPLIYPHLIDSNIATRENMGGKRGLEYIKKYINKLKINHDNIYVLKCDIKKYFYNIDHNLLLNKLKTLINDENIIKSTDQEYINLCVRECIHEEIKRVNDSSILDKEKRVKELESIPLYNEGFGLPIGNMTSQILAIYFLNEIDHYIKEQLHSKYYIRYMDDLMIIDYDKERLKK